MQENETTFVAKLKAFLTAKHNRIYILVFLIFALGITTYLALHVQDIRQHAGGESFTNGGSVVAGTSDCTTGSCTPKTSFSSVGDHTNLQITLPDGVNIQAFGTAAVPLPEPEISGNKNSNGNFPVNSDVTVTFSGTTPFIFISLGVTKPDNSTITVQASSVTSCDGSDGSTCSWQFTIPGSELTQPGQYSLVFNGADPSACPNIDPNDPNTCSPSLQGIGSFMVDASSNPAGLSYSVSTHLTAGGSCDIGNVQSFSQGQDVCIDLKGQASTDIELKVSGPGGTFSSLNNDITYVTYTQNGSYQFIVPSAKLTQAGSYSISFSGGGQQAALSDTTSFTVTAASESTPTINQIIVYTLSQDPSQFDGNAIPQNTPPQVIAVPYFPGSTIFNIFANATQNANRTAVFTDNKIINTASDVSSGSQVWIVVEFITDQGVRYRAKSAPLTYNPAATGSSPQLGDMQFCPTGNPPTVALGQSIQLGATAPQNWDHIDYIIFDNKDTTPTPGHNATIATANSTDANKDKKSWTVAQGSIPFTLTNGTTYYFGANIHSKPTSDTSDMICAWDGNLYSISNTNSAIGSCTNSGKKPFVINGQNTQACTISAGTGQVPQYQSKSLVYDPNRALHTGETVDIGVTASSWKTIDFYWFDSSSSAVTTDFHKISGQADNANGQSSSPSQGHNKWTIGDQLSGGTPSFGYHAFGVNIHSSTPGASDDLLCAWNGQVYNYPNGLSGGPKATNQQCNGSGKVPFILEQGSQQGNGNLQPQNQCQQNSCVATYVPAGTSNPGACNQVGSSCTNNVTPPVPGGATATPNPNPTAVPTTNPNATATPTTNPNATATPTTSPNTTITPISGTALLLNVALEGFTGSRVPVRTTEPIAVEFKELGNKVVRGTVTYDANLRRFAGAIALSNIPSGTYTIVIKPVSYLALTYPAPVQIVQDSQTEVAYDPTKIYSACDFNNDNQVNMQDVQQMFDDLATNGIDKPANQPANASNFTDITRDGKVDIYDNSFCILNFNKKGDPIVL